MYVFELHIGTAFNDDIVLDASEAKVHISHILWVVTKHAHDRVPKRLNKYIFRDQTCQRRAEQPILLYQSASGHQHPPSSY
jgi:hypothetical protein